MVLAIHTVIRLRVLFGYIILFSSLMLADNDADAVIEKLQKKYDGIRDASVTFTQHVKFGVTQSEQSFAGKLLMKKGNKYRIELEDQTIVTNGTSVWSYSKINKQVLIDKYKEDPASFSPDKVLVNVPNNYSAVMLGKEKIRDRETNILKLIPKSAKSNIQWMKVWVDDDEMLMRQIQYLDVSDNLTTYGIMAIKLNNSLKDDEFEFRIPKDVEVIDLR